MTNADDWEKVIQKAEETFGSVNVLVNNAGNDVPEVSIEEYPEETYRKVIEVNQTSVFYGMKYIVPLKR